MLYDLGGFGDTHLGAKGDELQNVIFKRIYFGRLKEAYLALLEHLRYSIRRQTTSIAGMSSTLSDKIAEHGTVVLPFRYVDCTKSLR
jgi:hypothetical protein